MGGTLFKVYFRQAALEVPELAVHQAARLGKDSAQHTEAQEGKGLAPQPAGPGGYC